MQAITAIRLLLHREAQILLVRPAVGDQLAAEFAVWRRRPVLVVEGTRRSGNGSGPCPMSRCESPTTNCCFAIGSRPSILRSGRARRIATDQEPQQLDQRGLMLHLPEAQLGADRHAGREQRRRPARHLRVSRAGFPLAGDEASQHGPEHPRSRAAAHQRPGFKRPAAEIDPRRAA